MTLSLERPSKTLTQTSEAAKIIEYFKPDVKDYTTVDKLEDEFPWLASQLGNYGLYLARTGDNLAGTFKWRGALYGSMKLQEQGAQALLVPSAGNHARGAVLAANILGMNAHVVVPKNAPQAKKEGLYELDTDNRLRLHPQGETFDEVLEWAQTNRHLGTILHPFDNNAVIAGQGTIASDILRSQPSVQHIVVPVGGGGLLAGIAQELTSQGRDDVILHAVEATGSNGLSQSLSFEDVTAATAPNKRYGGSAVRRVGFKTLAICQRYPNLNVFSVSDEEVNEVTEDYALDRHDLHRETTPNYEPTSLVALAGLRHVASSYPGEHITVVGTGHNAPLFTPSSTPGYRTAVSAGTFPR